MHKVSSIRNLTSYFCTSQFLHWDQDNFVGVRLLFLVFILFESNEINQQGLK